jgi:type I restriction enzyme M protein
MAERITQSQLESYLWGAAVLLRGTIDAGDYKQFIFPLLFYKRLCDAFDEETQTALTESGGDKEFAAFPENHRFQIPPEAHWREVRQAARDVGRALQGALRAIETANPDKLYGIFGDAQWTNKDRLTDAMLHDLIEHFSSLELTVANLPEDELGQGYEYLIKKFADDSGHTAAEFYTNRTVVHLMTEMLQPQPAESIYDPTCGSGGMLLSCIAQLRRQGKEWRNVRLYGQERNLMTSSIARMNCFLHGIEDFRIERGDTLSEPKFVQGDRLMQFDVVLANPPYSIKQWDRSAFASDPWGRNLYGTPPQGRADYAFQQHILKSLNPKTGRCAVLWPHGILFRNEEDEIRRKLIESDFIEAIIGLGPNLFYNSSMQSCIIVCRAAKPNEHKKKVLFIDAADEVARERAQSFLLSDHIEKIISAYQAFKDQPGFATVATLNDIEKNHWSLNIPLYVQSKATKILTQSNDSGTTPKVIAGWLNSSANVRKNLDALCPGAQSRRANLELLLLPANNSQPTVMDYSVWQKVRLGDVCEEISVRIDNPANSGRERFVGLEHFDPGELKVRRWGTTENLASSMKAFLAGDILFARRNAYLKRASQVDFDGLCSGDAIVLREKQDRIVSGFLAFVLNTNRFWEFAIANAAGTMSRRVNVKTLLRYEFALPPLDQQRRIAEILWAVDEEIQAFRGLKSAMIRLTESFIEEALTIFDQTERKIELREIISSDRPLCYGIVQPGTFVPDGVPFIRVCDMDGDVIAVSDLERVSQAVNNQYRRSVVTIGDILVTVVGTIGRVAVVGPECDKFNIARAVARLAPSEEVLPEFLAIILKAHTTQMKLLGNAFETARKTLNLSALEKLIVPLPSLKSQEEFLKDIRRINGAKDAIELKIVSSQELVSAIIDAVFSGVL